MTTRILTTRDNVLPRVRAAFLSPALDEAAHAEIDAACVDLDNECVSDTGTWRSDFLDCEVTVDRDADRAHEAVSRGIEILDRVVPGWQGKIHIDTLDIASGNDCVLAQVYGKSYAWGALNDFWIALVRAEEISWTQTIASFSFRHGFNVSCFDDEGIRQHIASTALTLAWKLTLSPS